MSASFIGSASIPGTLQGSPGTSTYNVSCGAIELVIGVNLQFVR